MQIHDIKTIKKFNKETKLSVSLQAGIPGPKQTKFIENQITNSKMMMCVYFGMSEAVRISGHVIHGSDLKPHPPFF